MQAATPEAQESPRPHRRLPRWWRRALLLARQINLFLWLEIAAAIGFVAMAATAWLAIARQADTNELLPTGLAAALLVGTLIPALSLIVLRGRRLAIRRAGATTARLHVNLVFLFSLLAAIPTLFVAVFASILFQSGAQFWFGADSRQIMEDANYLAVNFYDDNQRAVGAESLAMAGDLRFVLERAEISSAFFIDQYFRQLYSRNLSESAILHPTENGEVRTIAIAAPETQADRVRLRMEDVRDLRAGTSVVTRTTPERVEAITLFDRELDLYLYVARESDAEDIAQYQRASSVLDSYNDMTRRARALQMQFNVAIFCVSLALVALAVWAALRFADRQVKPLAELVSAAREIGSGNYALRVSGRTGPDEIGLLNRAFNRMTAQIERQTDALIGANRQLAERRAFIEAVLESLTAGIVSVDGQGQVRLMNTSAQQLLSAGAGEAPLGTDLQEIAPQLAKLVESGASSGIVQYSRGSELLTLAVKVAPATGGRVIAFEDITRQLLDQRQAAWSDVARRIAHEIKNPLTPIQLATERLNRRYRKQIVADGELFEELTGTIIRQVGSLRKMVDEFSSFARLPKPVFRSEDAVDLVRQAMFLQEVAHPEIDYVIDAAADIPHIQCDRHQFGQAMTNVLKNAAEAVDACRRDAEPDYRGRIAVSVEADLRWLTITVTDNGVGLPDGGERIMEPYVTTREKGTGLGLAIVKKIVEEHGGEVTFAAAPGGGARATLRFARDPLAAGGNPAQGSEAAE